MGIGIIVAIITLIVAILALFISQFCTKLSQIGLSASYQNEIRNWCGRCLSAMSKVKVCADAQSKQEFLAELWALIDEGRFFFPNVDTDGFGSNKLAVFRGLRSHILDYLVLYVAIFEKHEYVDKNDAGRLYREFLSEIFTFLQPSKFRLELNYSLRNSYAKIEPRENKPFTQAVMLELCRKYNVTI